MKKTLAVIVALGAVVAAAPTASASARGASPDLYLLESDGSLSVRDAQRPLLAEHRVKVRGLKAHDRLVGIDVRPATGKLYAIAKSGQLYTLDVKSGRATAVGTPAAGALGSSVGIDFNPTVDRIRVVTSSGRNLRVHPDTGAVAATDVNLAYAAGGSAPRVAAAGYTDSFAGATSTGLYVLDAARDALATQGTLPGATPVVSPNSGQLFPVGRLGRDISAVNGFDIFGKGRGSFNARDYDAIAAVRGGHGLFGGSQLVRVDLKTGRTSPLLALGLGDVVGLAYAAR
ncbi:DUF4394 domain-containing protein [Kribbella sandramycini]|uniref:DUF4394 domain-containing protein n=1 Tax=Kribbella sandramycini TaxID=60450 RepID=A0A7Y4L782_9ACTN|nr:DUF4394 domain-containing protein [Kribbella sandramycini]MBB6568893.1 hypothetical protein [Kribbella sandramycini]NOL45659.1 DUF4394 domain-containing protein [Kribbella sandramycini]